MISRNLPHEIWPPKADQEELEELVTQRQADIVIAGKTGVIAEVENLFLDIVLKGSAKYAITFNSGTSALLAAYFALDVGPGDEVIGPALTYHAALSPAFLLGASVRLVDIDKDTRCIDPTKIEAAITPNTKVITVVHQWGHPADMEKILEIANRHDLKVIEDCSHAHGSRIGDKFCGSFGDIAVFSLQANKIVYAGEGGILVTNNDTYHDRATVLGHYRDRSRQETISDEYKQFWVTGFGQKLRMSPLSAVVAKYSILNFPARVEGRHLCLKYFSKRLSEVPYIEVPLVKPDVYMGAWYGYKPLYLPEKMNYMPLDKVIERLRNLGMEVSQASAPVLSTTPMYASAAKVSTLKFVNPLVTDLPVALDVQSRSLSLPTFWDWNNDKVLIDEYIDAFKSLI